MQEAKLRWVNLGVKIRASRERAGLSLEELAKRISLSPTMLSAMERGIRGIKRDHMERIDRTLGTGGALASAWDTSSDSGLPLWYREGAKREKAATEIRNYHPLVIPGMLQAEDYMRALLIAGLPNESHSRIEELVRGRLDRQVILEGERAPRLLAVLDGGSLRRPIGGRETMRKQLVKLLESCDKPNVTVQVIPYETEYHPGMSNAFTLYAIPNSGWLLYTETRRVGYPTMDQDAVDDYQRAFSDLMAFGLPPAASRRLIADIEGEFS
ncbi:helix-turn-helix protein [Murinocardiopsis flavida]|uniref:Helix-turn-helix protein n=1 Tax=Murinocardiopsis flavida TaxID=645275 RepID=A0A2P8DFH8_9ACTN|nr:helix-turn-helix transcriptional regulator [Murinocardiopsis flavida]PSK95975.1 helix-turn-helix protein [Murinocardiopsis flavida]